MNTYRIVSLDKPACVNYMDCGNEARFMVDGVPVCARCAREKENHNGPYTTTNA